jgi:KDO2-lipid IV(A) lauroyltransferase
MFNATLELYLLIKPELKRVALINLKIAFPELTEKERLSLFVSHKRELARLFADMIKASYQNPEWVRENVIFKDPDLLRSFKQEVQERGGISATAHLGNFEIGLHALNQNGIVTNFVVRPFKQKFLNDWWQKRRASSGGAAIDRRGAIRGALRAIQRKESVGILFDQNVTKNHAAFVPLFGKKAATTKIIPLLVKKSGASLVFWTIKPHGSKFIIDGKRIEYGDILNDNDFTEKLLCRLHEELEKRIREYPQGWFWMHRRWRTQEFDERVY